MRWICAAFAAAMLCVPVWAQSLQPAVLTAQDADAAPLRLKIRDSIDGVKGLTTKIALVGESDAVGGRQILVAVDQAAPGSKNYVARLDLVGSGDFSGAPKLPFKPTASDNEITTGLVPVQAKLDGRDWPLLVQVDCVRQGGERAMRITILCAAQGQCQFGDTPQTIRVLDANGDLRLGGGLSGTGARSPARSADRLALADEKGQFKDSSLWPLNHPVKVGEGWYTVKIDPATLETSAEPANVQAGQVQIPHDRWTMLVQGKSGTLVLRGGQTPIDLPADTYRIIRYTEHGMGKAQLVCNIGNTPSQAGSFKVVAGETSTVQIGSPVVARVVGRPGGEQVLFRMAISDVSGLSLASLVNAAGGRPMPPSFVVMDETKKVVHRGTLQYG